MPIPYRRKNVRNGAILSYRLCYMITLRTKNSMPLFGEIKDGKMILSWRGEIARHFWEKTESVYPYTKLYGYVIMPEHIHGIIRILPTYQKTKSVSMMMKSFKREVTKEIHLREARSPKTIWLQSFWARGFRNERQLSAYERYIRNNPAKEWERMLARKKR
jgi:putative transposase